MTIIFHFYDGLDYSILFYFILFYFYILFIFEFGVCRGEICAVNLFIFIFRFPPSSLTVRQK